MLVEKTTLLSQLAPPLDRQLAEQLITEFIAQEKRFIQHDWEPSQLDGGQFCEVLARILYHRDSGNLSLDKELKDCLKYVEDPDGKNSHNIQPRQVALDIARVLRTVYRFRSNRGAVHISATYSPNHMDSKLVLEGVRWCFAETLRFFWNGDREQVATAIRELLQFDVPVIGNFANVLLVQRTDLTAVQEILVLLHYAGENGFSRSELTAYVKHDSRRISEALTGLQDSKVRQVVQLPSKNFRLTDLGSRYVREHLADKLLVE